MLKSGRPAIGRTARVLVPVCGQLHRVLTEYLRHYNTVRPHRSLDLQPPHPAPRLTLVEPGAAESPVQRVDVLGGLIHEYRRAA